MIDRSSEVLCPRPFHHPIKGMKKKAGSIRYSGTRTSPGTPEYGDVMDELPKSWSSERVPLPTSSSCRRHISSAAFMPFNSGRTLPSKWDDAERWITSPISGQGSGKTPISHPEKRPKSKSGPLGPPGALAYGLSYSPKMGTVDDGSAGNFMIKSPLATGVLVPEGLSIHYDSRGDASKGGLYGGNNVLASTSGHGLLDLQHETSLPSSQDDKNNSVNEEDAALVSRGIINRKGVATQMSPDGSARSSSGRFSFSNATSPIPSSLHLHVTPVAKDEVRDVQVDKGTTTSSQAKKRGPSKIKKMLSNTEDQHSPWNASEASKSASKLQREEAKIAAWENLQKAKAEASIRELEMKLEKKRSASMDKIMNKLQASQMKAESMRNSLSDNHSSSDKRIFFGCTYMKSCFLSQKS